LTGQVLDGRRRWLACSIAQIKPATREVKPSDPVAYVLSLNLHRRHLTPSQLSMVAARARELYDEQAKERQKARKGKQPGASPENLPELHTDARDAAGKAVGVSGRTVDFATKRPRSHRPAAGLHSGAQRAGNRLPAAAGGLPAGRASGKPDGSILSPTGDISGTSILVPLGTTSGTPILLPVGNISGTPAARAKAGRAAGLYRRSRF